jgi:hypothetical protein
VCAKEKMLSPDGAVSVPRIKTLATQSVCQEENLQEKLKYKYFLKCYKFTEIQRFMSIVYSINSSDRAIFKTSVHFIYSRDRVLLKN